MSFSIRRTAAAAAPAAGYYAAFIALGLTTASLGPTLTGLAENTGSTLQQISVLFLARSFGYLSGSLFGGRMFDRLNGGNRIMAAALLLMALCAAVTPGIVSLTLLAVLLFVLGMGEGVLDVGGNTLIVWTYRERTAPFMSALHFFYGVGALLSPIVVANALLTTGSIAWGYRAIALLVLPAVAVLLLRKGPSSPFQNGAEKPVAGQRPPLTAAPAALLVGLIVAFYFLFAGSESAFSSWISTYTYSLGMADQAGAAYLNSLFWGIFTLGRLAAIPISIRVKPGLMLVGDFVLCTLGLGIILLWPGSLGLLRLGVGLVGLGMASGFPMILTVAERRLQLTGQITALFFVGMSAGAMIIPSLIGLLFERVGPVVMMLVILFALLLSAAVYGIIEWVSTRQKTA